jgi:minor histocompatibility antigen H13
VIAIKIGAERAAKRCKGESLYPHGVDPNDDPALDAVGKPIDDVLTKKDAMVFPLVGSVELFSLYLALKVFGKETLNKLLGAYFLAFGVIAVTTTLSPWAHRWILSPAPAVLRAGEAKVAKMGKKAAAGKREDRVLLTEEEVRAAGGEIPWRTSIKFPWDDDVTKLVVYRADILSAFVGLAVGAWYFFTKSWIASNILGMSFSISGITFLQIDSYQVGAILLCGLFFYDIFWVFGTDVMVSVARGLDAPIKLLFPKNFLEAWGTDASYEFSMLGLGDVVIPAVFIALLLRYNRAYFNVNLIAYTLGLVVTMGVMVIFKAAQPALLFLVPACLGASMLQASVRGEFMDLLYYSEEKEETSKPAAAAADNKKNK